MRVAILAVLVGTFAVACASVPMAPKDRDLAAKSFETDPSTANLYVYRASSLGTAVKFPVSVDGRLLGSLPGSTFLLVSLPPGPHTLMVEAESDETLSLDLAAGTNTYVKVTPSMGFLSANCNLYVMQEAEARQDICGCELIQSN